MSELLRLDIAVNAEGGMDIAHTKPLPPAFDQVAFHCERLGATNANRVVWGDLQFAPDTLFLRAFQVEGDTLVTHYSYRPDDWWQKCIIPLNLSWWRRAWRWCLGKPNYRVERYRVYESVEM